ncbi:orotidine-5'-phosphate decarboxylase [Teredinibacter sp. KSP-S5-2]|uniref:orotidine-5'-phosphate decarboxylase n=1 Tax=Teredinibacter sp. KSP-S5-2 TaxID=3034506 RepID=UPI003977D125
MTNLSHGSRLLVALDFDCEKSCLQLVDQLDPSTCRLKVGKELFVSCGPQLVEKLQGKGFDIFLDLKFHDIPNTVAKAVKAAAELGVWMVNVHASGGERMMLAAREAIEQSTHKPLLIAVTVLTSMDASDLAGVGLTIEPRDQVKRLSMLAKQSGLDGVVCSAQELELIKAHCGMDFLCITPGIRPQGADIGDQKRIMTPEQAIQSGSDYIVVGRPITQATVPAEVCLQISQSIQGL